MKKILLFIAVMAISFMQAQVSLVEDFNIGSGDGIGNEIIEIDGEIVYAGNDGSSGFILRKSNATNSEDLGGFLTNPKNFYHWEGRNVISFAATAGTFPDGLWTWGNANGFVNGVDTSADNTTNNNNFTSRNSNVIFFSIDTQSSGNELGYSVYNGTSTLLKDINPAGSSNPSDFITLNGEVYFAANDGTNGRELWKAINETSTGVTLLADINPGGGSSYPRNLTIFNGKIYFTANTSTEGTELWVTDGTTAGTQLVLDLYPSNGVSSTPENLTVFNNALYFTADHPTLFNEIFKMNAAENITNLKDIANGGSSLPSDLFVFDGKLYFAASDNGSNGRELWSTTGFSSTTNMVKDINTLASSNFHSNPTELADYFGELYFTANDGVNGRELWKTDGTAAGTVLVSDINTSGNSNPENLTVAGDNLFFSASTPTTGKELFKYIDPSLVPDLELTISAPSSTDSNDVTATFTFSEPVTDFSYLDIYVDNGNLINFAVLSTSEYTATITPDSVCGQPLVISVLAGAAQNSNNIDSEAAQISIATIDDIAPTLTCPADTTVECGAPTDPSATGAATAFDNCETLCQPLTYPLANSNGNTEITYCGSSPCTGTQPDWGDVTIMQDTNNMTISIQMRQSTFQQWYVENVSYYLAPDSSFNINTDGTPIEDANWTTIAPPTSPASYTITIPLSNVPTDACYALGFKVGGAKKDFIGQIIPASRQQLYTYSTSSANQSDFLPEYCALPCGTSGATVLSSDTVADICGNTSIITRTWTATDINNNTSTCEQIISVVDTTGPTITCPADIVRNNDVNTCGAIVNFSATATDSCGSVSITYDIASGSTFAVGITTINVTATDDCNNTSICNFDITVNDIDAPVVTCPSNQNESIVENTSYTIPDYTVNNMISVTDCSTYTYVQTPAPGTMVTQGTHNISTTFTDANNNSIACAFDLVISETLSIDNSDLANTFNIYPNPVETTFSIDTEKIITKISIYDIRGKLIKTFSKSQVNYNIEDLTVGMYFINVASLDGNAIKKLIVK